MRLSWLLLLILNPSSARAQFDLQDSHTTASLRGIDAPSPSVGWASGTDGTVLRTVDGGAQWQHCAIPPDAAKLDFRGVQALDASAALVMASGKGEQSRIYKTTDACKTWKLVFTNPDPDGFFDAMRRVTARQVYLLGDPVGGKFAMFLSQDGGETWFIADDPGLEATPGDAAFAASNSSLLAMGATLFFATGGTNLPRVYATHPACPVQADAVQAPTQSQVCPMAWARAELPMAGHGASAGAFSLAGRTLTSAAGKNTTTLVAVGGTYDKPLDSTGTAVFSTDSGRTWHAAETAPGGYRSATAFDRMTQSWLAVGPSGSDVSHDDGRTWKPLPLVASGTASDSARSPDTASGWNAIALPYVVGARGRIGKLPTGALKP